MTHTDSNEEDLEMLKRMNEGDYHAFEFLFRKYYRPLCAFVSRFVAFYEVEDVAVDCLVSFWENRDQIDIRCFSTYLFGSAYHRCLRIIDRKRLSREILEYITAYGERFDTTPAEVLERKELARRIEETITQMPPSYREAFLMHRFQGKTYAEIALEKGVSVKTIEYRIGQALRILRGRLNGDIPVILILIAMTAIEARA